jgi:membrane-bound lytic murein transglycosylase F
MMVREKGDILLILAGHSHRSFCSPSRNLAYCASLITIPDMRIKFLVTAAVLTSLLAGLSACGKQTQTNDLLERIQNRGYLSIITRNGPTTYYEGAFGPTGFEYELASRFAEYLGVQLELESTHNLQRMFEALANGQVDIAAAGLTITEERKQFLDFSAPYKDIQQQVLYRKNTPKPQSPEDLIGHNILVIANSSHSEILGQLSQQHPELRWRAAADAETPDLLDELMAGNISYTIIDSNEYLSNRAIYPDIKTAFDIGEPGQLAWAMAKSPDNRKFKQALSAFFQRISEDGTLRQLQERFYSHVTQNDAVGLMTFNQKIAQRLPKYLPLIKEVAEEVDLQWQLLAAISYQESHWNPRAKSPTGVRGMMMLTLPTAKEMGVKNRLNAEQSLRGGARYFKKILNRIPHRIQQPDRTWLALAAYNIGMGHLEDARKITEGQGDNPDSWADVKSRLPMLAKSRVYKYTKHGYARGHEALHYVQNIRQFYTVLSYSEEAEARQPPPKNADQYVPDKLKGTFEAL